MNSRSDAPGGLQLPRVQHYPTDVAGTAGADIAELMVDIGQPLDPWQEYVLIHAMGERPATQKWAAFEVGVDVARQNGKGGIIEARTLGGLFVLEERMIIHSAHQFDTSLEAFSRLVALIEGSEWMSRKVKRIVRSHGEEGITLTSGQRVRFRTRTKGGGRGFTCDCLFLDEAMILPTATKGALMPTLSARPNPQIWYLGSAVDQQLHEHGMEFARVRARGHAGTDDSLAWFEWSACDTLDELTPEMAADPAVWAMANPALDIRISHEHVAREQRSMAPRTFAVERLGVGDWPDPDGDAEGDITREMWRAIEDPQSTARDPLVLGIAVKADRSMSAIGASGMRDDGLRQIGVIDHRPGTAWVVDRCVELVEQHEPVEVVIGGKGPASSLIEDLKEKGVKVHVIGLNEEAEGCALLLDAIGQRTVRHLGTPELAAATRGVVKRTVGDVDVWSRRKSTADISPLEAVTLAFWGSVRSVVSEPLVAWR